MRALIAFIVITAGIVYFVVGRGAAVNTAATEACQSQPTALAKLYDDSVRNRVVRAAGTDQFGSTFEVDETVWRLMTHNGKIALALSMYCRVVGPNGRGTVVVDGLHDGQTKASVVNGNYSDS